MLVGIMGKKQVGKDLSTNMLHTIDKCYTSGMNFSDMYAFYEKNDVDWSHVSRFKTKKFANKVKEIAALLLSCDKKMFEDEEFKNMVLPDVWNTVIPRYRVDEFSFIAECTITMTNRQFLQKIGTDCFRNNLHPNTWVNALFSEYKPAKLSEYNPSNWIINDVRFPNEAEAIKERGGLLIKINRNTGYNDTHESETTLDNYQDWDFVIDNNSSKEELFNNLINIYKEWLTLID